MIAVFQYLKSCSVKEGVGVLSIAQKPGQEPMG